MMTYVKLILRSLYHRVRKAKPQGVTDYFVGGFDSRVEMANRQLEYHKAGNVLLEIGCGRDLHLSILAALKWGFTVKAFDIEALAELDLINYTIKRLGYDYKFDSLKDLEQIGIHYCVGSDILICGDFDAVISNASFEHIPVEALHKIFDLCEQKGIKTISGEIDFNDHWSYIENVSWDHFYYVSPILWKILNNKRMYQNCLRINDFDNIAKSSSYYPKVCKKTVNPLSKNKKINSHFYQYTINDLSAATALVVYERA